MEQVKQKLKDTIAARKDEIVALARDLIRFPSTKGNEADAQCFYADKLRDLGAEVEIFEPDIEKMRKHPAFVSERETFAGSPVVAGVLKGTKSGKSGRSLILCGHMDVVDPGLGQWTHSPWDPVAQDGKLYGRGAVDMKGGTAAHYTAVKVIREMGIQLEGNVTILSTIDEECGSTGVLSLIDRGYRADAAICTEPVSLKVTVATTGSTWFKIKVFGKSAHGGVAYTGVNALYKAIPIIERVRSLEEERRLRLFGAVPIYNGSPVPFCAGVNKIEGGTWPAIVPAEVTLEGRVGLSPFEKLEDVQTELEEAIYSVAKADPWLRDHMPEISYYKSRWNSGCVPEDHAFVDTLREACKQVRGTSVEVAGMFACSDSGTLIQFGGTPTVDFGPGPQNMAHQTDEYVDIEDLVTTCQVIAVTLLDWCAYQE
ncbi:MAG: ArgE/DapE family deacylase [Synergistaceae bacterium]|jgi:acetylornithine deacetylase|nr:ArgE/DapE family deacylase [Synergistaceae bacterium]